MRILLLIKFIFILQIACYSKVNSGLKIYFSEKSPKSFFEGENIIIFLIIENTSNDTLPFSQSFFGGIKTITDINDKIVDNGNYSGYQIFKSHQKDKSTTTSAMILNSKINPKEKIYGGYQTNFSFFSNATTANIFPEKKIHFEYLKEGDYFINYVAYFPEGEVLLKYKFTILKPIVENLNRFKEYLEAVKYSDQNDKSTASASFIGDTTKPTLMKFLIKYKSGPYTQSAFDYIKKYGINYNYELFWQDPNYVNCFLSLIPIVFQGKEWYFASEFFSRAIFVKNGFCIIGSGPLSTKEEMINSYLKVFENFPKEFSHNIIISVEDCANSSKLTNFASLKKSSVKN